MGEAMRIVLIGQAMFAEKVFAGLRDREHSVVAVVCPPDRDGGRPDPLKVAAADAGIPVRQHASLKGPDVAMEFAEYSADLGVLAYVTQIVPPAVIDAPRLGSICFHPSLLPRYRGGSAIPWQIIKGETRTGVSVFWTDAGIDTGPILLQKESVIAASDTAASLYYDRLFPLGVETVIEAVDLVASGTAPRVPQDGARGSYDPLLTDEHARIDWDAPLDDVYNLVRGCDPRPGAYVQRDQARIRLFGVRCLPGSGAAPGVLEAFDDGAAVIGASGGALRVERLRVQGPKRPAREVLEGIGLQPGERF